MAKKKPSKQNNSIESLIDNLAARAINTVAEHGLNRLSQEAGKYFGVGGAPIQDQIAQDRSKLQLEKQQAETTKIKAVSAMEIEMFRIKLEEKEIAIQEKRRLLEIAQEERVQLTLPEPEMVVDGALTIPQDKGGIIFPDEPEGYQEWLDSLPCGKVILVLGKRGSGKTALAARIAEFISATFGLAIYWVGLPEAARNLLPHWVKLVNDPGQVPNGSVVLADEAGLRYASLAFNSKDNKMLRSKLMIARHNYTSLIFAVHSSRDLEASIVRNADSFIFKQPGFNQPETERLDIRPMARKAADVFQQIPADKRPASAMVFDDLFTGGITTTVPSFWSDDLSHVYRHIDLQRLETKAGELDQVVREETKLMEADSLDSKILKLRSEDHGVEKISKLLNCSLYRVRKCLNM
ncbi:ATP-binding protein [Chloroflexota bacterium]